MSPRKLPDNEYAKRAHKDAQTVNDQLTALITAGQNGTITLPQMVLKLKDCNKLLPAMVVHYTN